jgi:broad specificity phosphatase PhoE
MDRFAPPTRVTLITHAASRAQREGVFPLDESLEEAELRRLAAVLWRAPHGAQVLTAPELRARQTAAALGLTAEEAPALRECDFGRWGGCGLEVLGADDPEGLIEWMSDVAVEPHGGESFAAVISRTARWLDGLHGGGHTVAVTHGTIVRAAVVMALGAPTEAFLRLEVAPLTVTDLRLTGRQWRVRSVGVPLLWRAAES